MEASTGHVFKTPRGNELKVRLVRELCVARDRAGIPDFRFHDLRHTFATRLVQRGIDLYEVQRLLGQKTSHMTNGNFLSENRNEHEKQYKLVVSRLELRDCRSNGTSLKMQ